MLRGFAGSVLALLVAVAATAQQPTQPTRADSAARADSIARSDSARIAHERERIKHEQRPHPPPVTLLAPDTGQMLVLTRAQAIAMALDRNPQLAAARQQVAQARARVTEATALPDPGISATIVGQSGPFRPGTANERDYAVGLTIPFPDKIRLSGQVATADVRSAELAYTQLRQQIASETAQTYDSLLVAERHQQDYEQARQLASDFVAKTQARFEGGTSPRLDVVKAKVDLASAENQLIAQQRNVTTARAALNRLIGRLLGAPVGASDSLTIPAGFPALDTLERQALANRPEVRSLDAQRAGASAATTLAKEFWLPDISLSVSRNRVFGTPNTFDTGIGIGFPIFFWQHTHGLVAESRHREMELLAARRDLVAQVSQEVRVAYAGAVTALQQVVWIRDQLLPEAEQAYRIASTSYALGGSSALEVLDAKRTLLDAQSQYTDALGAVNDAAAQLQLAVGAPLSGDTTGGSND